MDEDGVSSTKLSHLASWHELSPTNYRGNQKIIFLFQKWIDHNEHSKKHYGCMFKCMIFFEI